MNFQWLPANTSPALTINLPVVGYLVTALFAIVTLLLVVYSLPDWRELTPRHWLIFAAGVLFAPLLNLVLIVESGGQTIALLGYLPLLAVGLWLGTGPALVVGILTGLAWALVGPGRLTLPFEMALLAAVVVPTLRQRYRGFIGTLFRYPLATLPLSMLLVGWPLQLLGIFATGQASLVVNLERMATLSLPLLTVNLIAATASGLLLQFVLWIWPALRPVNEQDLLDAPWALHLDHRIIYSSVPAAVLAIVLLGGVVAGTAYRVATQLMVEQMTREAATIASQTPFFIQIGRSLIRDFARDADLLDLSTEAQLARLEQAAETVPFFQQLILVDNSLTVVRAYPEGTPVISALSEEEASQVAIAFQGGVPAELAIYGGTGAPVRMSFFAAITERDTGEVQGALVGRTTLSANPLLEPVINLLNDESTGAGEGYLLDRENRILLYPAHPERQQQRVAFDDQRTVSYAGDGQAFRQREDDGTRQLIYRLPITGRSEWSVVLVVPNEVVLSLALQIALPTLLLMVFLMVVALLLVHSLGRSISAPLEQLAGAAGALAEGSFSHQLHVSGEDEIGRLGRAFDQMSIRLQQRLEEQERLLNVSRSVSSSLELFRAMPPILSGALDVTDAAGVRVVLRQDENEDVPLRTYAAGEAAAAMAVLDAQLIDLVERQGTVVISQLWRASGSLDTSNLLERIKALVAFPLRSDTQFHGLIWAGYDEERIFDQSEMTFLSTLAGQAAVAVSNARLFTEAEEGRRKLEAVLESTADGMIVVDNDGRVTLINPAAEEYFGVRADQATGKKAAEVIATPELADLMTDLQEPVSVLELPHQNGRTLLAATSTIVSNEGGINGRVAVLRDITPLKELDNIKTVFLRMVSHDLRSPLTYMRGYASMLPLNGTLNERQQQDLERIRDGIDHIKQMTERLTYLSRLQFGEEAELERSIADVEDLLDEIAMRHISLAEDKDIMLAIELEEGLPLIFVDVMLYGQAISNLIHNALKYSAEGGTVNISAYRKDPDHLTVAVEDSGMGIREEDQSRLFEAFYSVPQQDDDPPRPKGTGLGLALVEAIASAHGGEVRVDSEWGEGATFEIVIPIEKP